MVFSKFCFATVAFSLLAGQPQGVSGWGFMGHKAVADVAQRYLTPNSLSKALEILDKTEATACDDTPNHGRPFANLSEAANWADCINRRGGIPAYHWTKPLHFAYFPDTRTSW